MIKHQITTGGVPLPGVAGIASQLSGMVTQAQAMVTAGVGLPGLQDIGTQIANLAPSIGTSGGPAAIASALTSLGSQMSTSNMAGMSSLLTSMAGQITQLNSALGLSAQSQVIHTHLLDKNSGIVHSAFGGQHTVQLLQSGMSLMSTLKVSHTAPVLPHNGLGLFSDALNVTKGVTGASFGMLSDRRLKTRVRRHAPVLAGILRLRLKTFLIKALDFESGRPTGDEPRISFGYIAQQVAKIFPALVTREGDYLRVEEGKIGLLAAAAVAELHAEMSARIATLEARIAELEK